VEQNTNKLPEAATNEPAFAETSAVPPMSCVSDRPVESLIEAALECGRDPRPGRAPRADGWTPAAIRTFLGALARNGSVADAARAAGMSRQSAYALRARPGGHAFDVAWTELQRLARRPADDGFMSRALHGYLEPIIRDGWVWGERHRFDNRCTMAALTRLDRSAASNTWGEELIRITVEEFDQIVEMACRCLDAAAADAFILSRLERGHKNWPGTMGTDSGAPEEASDGLESGPDPRTRRSREPKEKAANSNLLFRQLYRSDRGTEPPVIGGEWQP
jgi:hypothetical protein